MRKLQIRIFVVALLAVIPQLVVAEHQQTNRIAMGPDHACVVLANHAMVCRGKNERGQLGVGDSIDRGKLSPILGLQGVATASAGWWHTCAARSDGSVLCWGMNKNGSLGTDDDAEKLLRPTPVPGISDVVGLAAGLWHTCARTRNGKVSCWGQRGDWQLGTALTQENVTIRAIPEASAATSIAAGGTHSCAVKRNGEVVCWGKLRSGISIGGTSPRVVPGLSDVVSVAVGGSHVCALKSSGTVSCWGANGVGQLGTGESGFAYSQDSPVSVIGLTDVVQIAAGAGHSCALNRAGNVSCWGDNRSGQLGLGDDKQRSAPALLDSQELVVELAAAGNQTCVIKADDKFVCWGG